MFKSLVIASAISLTLAGSARADTASRSCGWGNCLATVTTSAGEQVLCTLPGNGLRYILRGGIEKPTSKPARAYCFTTAHASYDEVPYQNGWPVNLGSYGHIIGLRCSALSDTAGQSGYQCDWPPYAQATYDLDARRRHAAGED